MKKTVQAFAFAAFSFIALGFSNLPLFSPFSKEFFSWV
jgi:hypothetical protein